MASRMSKLRNSVRAGRGAYREAMQSGQGRLRGLIGGVKAAIAYARK